MTKICSLGAVAALVLTLSSAGAEEPNGRAGLAPLFADDSVLAVTIEAPIEALMDVRPDKAYLKGRITYADADGSDKTIGLKLRTRGNYRRDPEHCDFAPILLNLKKGEVPDTLFAGQDKLKLVTHCQSNVVGYEQNLLREYLAYRLFRELTSASYATRLFRITYADPNGKSLTRYGFVIEDDKAVAKRNGMKIVKTRHLHESEIDPKTQNLVNVFQYMIGNTEYSLVNPEPKKNCCHNADVLAVDKEPPYFPLPFDFDFSGLVNAPYAQPNPRYPIPNVRVRFYRGLCEANEILPETLQLFLEKMETFDRIIKELQPAISRRTRNLVRSYLDEFYEEISDPALVQQRLLLRCYAPADPNPGVADPRGAIQ
jgi:hypothetical protein